MGLEINILRFLTLIYVRYDQLRIESCLKYFFVQSLGSALFLSIFYIGGIFIGRSLFLVIRYRIGAAPFYFWFPTVCRGLNWLSCLVLLSIQKIIPLILIALFIRWMIWLIVIMSLVCGAFGSLNQRNLKQLFAYSSIHHLGWIFICNICNDFLWIIYMLIYIVIIFSVIVILIKSEIVYIDKINDGKDKFWFSLRILSIGGIPPILGFFLKWIAFIYIIHIRLLYVLIMVLISVLIFYIYFRIVYNIYIYIGMVGYYNKYIYQSSVLRLDLVRILGIIIRLCIFFFIC